MISSVSKKDIKIVDKEYEIDEQDEHKFARDVSKPNLRADNQVDETSKPTQNTQMGDADVMPLNFPNTQFTINTPNTIKPELKEKIDDKPIVTNIKKTKKNLNEILNNPDEESDYSDNELSPKNKRQTPKHKNDDDEFDVVVDMPKKKPAKDLFGNDHMYTEHNKMNHHESHHHDISYNSQMNHRVQFISQDENNYEEGGVRFYNQDG